MLRNVMVIALLVFAAGCGARKAAIEDVQKTADLFFQRLNDADYDAIYKDTSAEYKKQETRESTIEKLTQLAPYVKGRSPSPIRTPILDDGKTVQPVYGVASETNKSNLRLTFVDEKGEWKLRGFELLTK